MFETTIEEKEKYYHLMQEIKKLNNEYKSIKKSKQYKIGFAINYSFQCLKHRDIKEIWRLIQSFNNKKYMKNINKKNKQIKMDNLFVDYTSSDKIVIYTCVFGNYDDIIEPRIKPNNCDYYIITDQEIPKESIWNKIDINPFKEEIKNYTNAEKNRYFKILPHKIFKNYKYSIYIDGNIEIFTDLTEYINYMKDNVFITHLHSKRNCVYSEGLAVIRSKKEKEENVKKYLLKIQKDSMPQEYGLLECNILVRKHNDKQCISIMEQWWNEFKYYIKRDQLALPYILYKNNIKVEEVGLMGENIFNNPSFRVIQHHQSGWKYE